MARSRACSSSASFGSFGAAEPPAPPTPRPACARPSTLSDYSPAYAEYPKPQPRARRALGAVRVGLVPAGHRRPVTRRLRAHAHTQLVAQRPVVRPDGLTPSRAPESGDGLCTGMGPRLVARAHGHGPLKSGGAVSTSPCPRQAQDAKTRLGRCPGALFPGPGTVQCGPATAGAAAQLPRCGCGLR